jgi:CHAD domain-containing protein
MTAHGIELLLPEALGPSEAVDALHARLPLREGEREEHELRFYDTFDGLLHDAGLAFVHEDGRATLISLGDGGERAAMAVASPPARVFAADVEPGAMRDALADVIDVRALLPLVHLHRAERRFGVLDANDKTVARLALAEAEVIASPHRRIALAGRLRIVPVRGYHKAEARLHDTLVDELGLPVAKLPLLDDAVLAAGGQPGGVSSKVDVALARDQRADSAAASILKRLVQVMDANLPGTIADVDPEFLHDYRVAVRRSRAVMRELKRAFPAAQLARFRIELRWLQQVTGPSRDLDVYVLDFDELTSGLSGELRGDLEPLRRVIRDRRVVAHREMVRELRGQRAERLRDQWPAFLDGLVMLPVDDRPDAVRPIAELAGERISKVYRTMVKMGHAIDDSSPAEALHELRKKGKELRYLLELLGLPLYSGDVVKPLIRSLKSLQDVLGRHQDREVQIGTLRSFRDGVAAVRGGPAALMAMGVLIEHLGRDVLAARAEFAAVFADFASRSQRRLVRETFGP